MSEQEVRALLALAMGYDNRKPGEAAIAAWCEAARIGRWTFPEAREAIVRYYVDTPGGFVTVGDITQRIREARRHPPRAQDLKRPALPSAVASEETRERAMAEMRRLIERTKIPEDGS